MVNIERQFQREEASHFLAEAEEGDTHCREPNVESERFSLSGRTRVQPIAPNYNTVFTRLAKEEYGTQREFLIFDCRRVLADVAF